MLNKIDMIPADERDARVKEVVRRLRWKGPVFAVSALAREGLPPLLLATFDHVALQRRPLDVPDLRFAPQPQEGFEDV